MSAKGPSEPFKRLLPQSWLGWIVALVLGVVTVTHPAESWHTASVTVWGAGRWVGYEAFADCGTPPPYGWMSEKHCPAGPADPAVTVVTVVTVADQAPSAAPPRDDRASVDRVVVEATHLHRIVDQALTDDGAKCSQTKGCGS